MGCLATVHRLAPAIGFNIKTGSTSDTGKHQQV